MKTMTILLMTVSTLYASMSNPMMFMALIVIQSLLICGIAWVTLNSSWFSYIVFLIFLGGLMVLFIYITSLASNEMFSLNFSLTSKTILSTLAISSILVINTEMLLSQPYKPVNMLSLMFASNLKFTLILTMIYLLLTLIVVVKITNKMDAPIKNII